MINLNQLRVFYCVAKNISFTKAAEELFITQPAVTAQVKLFEEWCELKFFKKKGRGIALTDEGETLYRHACEIFEHEKKLESIIDDMKHLKQGVLRLGTPKTYARHLMPFITRRFHERYPQIKICLDEGSSLKMIESVLKLENEIAIVATVKSHPDLEVFPFAKEEIVPIVNPQHPLAKQSSVSVEQLSREPLIMRETGSGTRKCTDDLFNRHQCKPNILMETPNTPLIIQLVVNGDGVALLVKEAVLAEIQTNKLVTVPLQEEQVFLDNSVYYLKNQPLSGAAKAFIQLLDELTKNKRPVLGIRTLLS